MAEFLLSVDTDTSRVIAGENVPDSLEPISQSPLWLPERTVTAASSLTAVPGGPTVGQYLDSCRRWLGTVEQPDGSNHVPGITDQPGFWDDFWCAMGTSVACRDVGIKCWTAAVAGIIERAQAGRDGWTWHDTPQLGAAVCYDYPGNTLRTDHVDACVEAIRDDGAMVTIGFNVSNMVKRLVRDQRDDVIGYALPPFASLPPPDPWADLFVPILKEPTMQRFPATQRPGGAKVDDKQRECYDLRSCWEDDRNFGGVVHSSTVNAALVVPPAGGKKVPVRVYIPGRDDQTIQLGWGETWKATLDTGGGLVSFVPLADGIALDAWWELVAGKA